MFLFIDKSFRVFVIMCPLGMVVVGAARAAASSEERCLHMTFGGYNFFHCRAVQAVQVIDCHCPRVAAGRAVTQKFTARKVKAFGYPKVTASRVEMFHSR